MEQGLAAREAYTANASVDQTADHGLPGFEVQTLAHIGVVLVGTAIDARQVASVRERQADRPRRSRGRGSRAFARLQDGQGVHEALP
jgi:hypothetical protein